MFGQKMSTDPTVAALIKIIVKIDKIGRRKKLVHIILNIQQNLNFRPRTEDHAFALVFVRKKNTCSPDFQ